MVKVERSYPASAGLLEESRKPNGTYRIPEVEQRLIQDFHNKCYICEIGPLQDFEIEHLLPHKNGKYPERKFDWDNLFWSCGHCNSVKNNKKYEEGILDCTKVDPEEFIYSEVESDQIIFQIRKGHECQTVIRTQMLLNEVFNSPSTSMRQLKCTFRVDALREEMLAFYKALEKWKQNHESRIAIRKLRGLLSRQSRFAAFKRDYIRSHRDEFPELANMIK